MRGAAAGLSLVLYLIFLGAEIDNWLFHNVEWFIPAAPILLAGGITLTLVSFKRTPFSPFGTIATLVFFTLASIVFIGYFDLHWFPGLVA